MKKPGSTEAGTAGTAGRRRRLVAASIGVSALLALGGVAWASGQGGAARASDTQGGAGNSASPPSDAAVKKGTTPSAVPGPAVSSPEAAPTPAAPPAAAPAQAAPPAAGPADPGPVDRNGKSDQELAEIPQPTAAPVEIKAKKAVKGGVSATITELEAVQGEATGIGEVAGPSVRFKVTVTNDTAKAISLDAAVVDVSYGKDEEPAGQLSGPDGVVFPASVEPGTSGVGVFVFSVPPDARDKVKIHFNLEAETPVATFEGKLP
ncbi:hypothetical protein BJG92_01751 [Arthrobacter sp. SO5]|uniref:hypothetical protein n=1 Tax=Arthrobacter sp. SO5 TaxID=1897055 RepID=UPI001E2A55DA|nr:hypothetical protein [Arthrobacter sp. SO5]MCB5274221.1 hypothetical protein [Arthrobacter sp. SO5]